MKTIILQLSIGDCDNTIHMPDVKYTSLKDVCEAYDKLMGAIKDGQLRYLCIKHYKNGKTYIIRSSFDLVSKGIRFIGSRKIKHLDN